MKILASAVALAVLLAGCSVMPEGPSHAVAPVVQRGLVLPTWERHGYTDSDTVAALHDIAALGADWVQIVPTWYQPTRTANAMGPTDDTVADDDVRGVIAAAHAAGLAVLLKPHVDVADGTDRGLIEPVDRGAWFRAYRDFIGHYARMARYLGVEQLAVGTELQDLSTDRPAWLRVIADVRGDYGGQLVYAANHTEYQTVAFWDAVDLIGIDVYWSLAQAPTADVGRLERTLAARRDELAALSARFGRRILFTEAGFPSQRGGVTAPWSWTLSSVPAQAEQAAAYEAMLATFTGEPWWAGVFWWTWTVAHRHAVEVADSLDHSVRGKLAADVLRRWWTTSIGAAAGRPGTG